MAIYNDLGIIFKIRDFGEADKIVSVLGKRKGRIDAIAKGARRPTSRKTSSIDLMNFGKFSFAEGKNLDILTEVQLEDSFEVIKNNFKISKHLFYLSELIDSFFPEVSQGEEVFELLSDVLNSLDESNYPLLSSTFELKLLDISGFGPNVHSCTLCGDEIITGVKRVPHSGSEIGFICAKHLNKESVEISEVPDRIIKILRFLIEEDVDKVLGLKILDDDFSFINKLNRLWLQSIIGKPIKSYKFLD
jgi:DNA repair protein RecO (recombination protein O)